MGAGATASSMITGFWTEIGGALTVFTGAAASGTVTGLLTGVGGAVTAFTGADATTLGTSTGFWIGIGGAEVDLAELVSPLAGVVGVSLVVCTSEIGF